MRPAAIGVAFLAWPLAFCGGRSSEYVPGEGGSDAASDDRDSAELTDAISLGDVRQLPDCGEITFVPAGQVYVGAWTYSSAQGFSPSETCDATRPGSKKLSVAHFFLMDEPVTNVCYSECVKEGACSVPQHDIADPNALPWDSGQRAGLPVYVDQPAAQGFCAWLGGGYLPSLAQILRAAQGDASEPSVSAMTAAAISCSSTGASSQICDQIAAMNLSDPANGLYEVGQIVTDVGPFGHRDLYGDGFEWTRTFADFTDSRFCALADGAPDYVTFQTNQFSAVQFATLEEATLAAAKKGEQAAPMMPGNADPATISYTIGFRCAFDSLVGAGIPD